MNPESPLQRGIGLAAITLGTACVPLSVYVGVQSLTVDLPIFGVWYFLPVIIASIMLGLFAARSAFGIAGTILGVVALIICMGFVVLDRVQGPVLRRPTISTSPPPGLSSDQLLRALRSATTTP